MRDRVPTALLAIVVLFLFMLAGYLAYVIVRTAPAQWPGLPTWTPTPMKK